MVSGHLFRRSFPIGACAAAVVLCATPPASADKRATCTAANAVYEDALESEKSGHLQQARELLQSCMQAKVCGGLVPKCTEKYSQLGADMPSVVPVVTDEAGEPRVDVQVRVDGALLVSRLDGQGLPVEPGLHEFTFSTHSGVFSTQRIMIVEGQRNRPILASLHATDKGAHKTTRSASAPPPAAQTALDPPAPDKPASDASSPREIALPETAPAKALPEDHRKKGGRSAWVYVLGGAGLLGVGAGGLLTYWGIKDNESLANCSPNCHQASVDHIRSLYLASDVSLGVGVGALGVATWLFIRSGSSDEKPPSQEAFKVDVHPTPSGAFASVSRTF